MRSGYVLKTFYTLEEVFGQYLEEQGRHEWDAINFYSFFKTRFAEAPIYKTETNEFKDYINDLLIMVYSRYKGHYCISNYLDDITEEDISKVTSKLVGIIVMTYPKYAELMKYYKSLEGQLMKQIGSSTVSVGRFNDTPQNGGDFADDEHTSNITRSEVEVGVDGDTPIERLSEIKAKLSSILYDWSNEFDKIFIEEGNI